MNRVDALCKCLFSLSTRHENVDNVVYVFIAPIYGHHNGEYCPVFNLLILIISYRFDLGVARSMAAKITSSTCAWQILSSSTRIALLFPLNSMLSIALLPLTGDGTSLYYFLFFLSLFHVFFTTLFFIGLRRPHPRCLKLDQPQWPYAQRNHNAPYRHIVFGPYDRPFGAPKTRPGAR